MKSAIVSLLGILLLAGLFVLCDAVTPPGTGDLVVMLTLMEPEPPVSAVSGNESRIHSGPEQTSQKKGIPGKRGTDGSIDRIRFMLQPDDISQEFDYSEGGTYTLELPLAFYNVRAEAMDATGLVLYLGDTTRILVEPNEETQLNLNMSPNQPVTAPVFLGLDDINYTVLDHYELTWSSVKLATTYRLEEAGDAAFTSPRTAYTGTDTTFSFTGKSDSTYHYRVRAEGILGVSRWSDAVSWVVDQDLALTILTESLPIGALNVAYDQSILAQGGSAEWTWSLAEGSLPTGLEFQDLGATGRVYGTPTAVGTYDFVVRIEDDRYIGLADTQSFSLVITDFLPLQITTPYLPAATGGSYYSTYLEASGGTTPYTWTLVESDPDWFVEGMTLTADGHFYGTVPNWACTARVRFRVVDSSDPQQSDRKYLTWIIRPGPITLFDSHTDDGTVGVAYAGSIFYEGGTSPYQSPWTVTGSLPPGLSFTYLDYNMAVNITGTPTTAGTFNFQVTVRDSSTPQKTRTDSFSIKINTPMAKPALKRGEAQ